MYLQLWIENMRTIFWVEKKRNPFAAWNRSVRPFFSEKQARDSIILIEWDASGFSVEARVIPEDIEDDARWKEICEL